MHKRTKTGTKKKLCFFDGSVVSECCFVPFSCRPLRKALTYRLQKNSIAHLKPGSGMPKRVPEMVIVTPLGRLLGGSCATMRATWGSGMWRQNKLKM